MTSDSKQSPLVSVRADILIGAALDYAVAKALGWINYPDDSVERGCIWYTDPYRAPAGPRVQVADFTPSTNWSQGGALIDKYQLGFYENLPSMPGNGWECRPSRTAVGAGWSFGYGPTHLIAAMRCIVLSRLGETVQVPAELLP